jgi:cellulose synthase/poly-beta-1,6-N-acetylglucosamine synthase-like glycosyltransferase
MPVILAVGSPLQPLVGVFLLGASVISLLLILQATHTIYLMIYTWDKPELYQKAQIPARFRPPQKSFTVMLPARHEEEVIQTTI